MTTPTQAVFDELTAINTAIGEAESRADTEYFRALLHERFTMRRPLGDLATKEAFIAGLASGAERRTTILEVQLHGKTRATARTLTHKWDLATPDQLQVFDNLRVFVHQDGRWLLLTWLTEPYAAIAD